MLKIIGIVIGVIVFCYIVREVYSWLKSNVQDAAARSALAEFDFSKEEEEIKSVGSKYVSETYRCPNCSGMLVRRLGKYGEFWGCNHYPECKYTRSLR